MRFLNLSLADRVPDEKTVWAFREELGKLGLESKLFEKFDGCLMRARIQCEEGADSGRLHSGVAEAAQYAR